MRFTPDHPHRANRRHEVPADIEHQLLQTFGDAEPAPDLVPRIMNRLGYMHVPPVVARRRRWRRTIGRSLTCLVALILIGIAAQIHHHGPDARRPAGLTLPQALSHDLDRHQQSFIRTIQTIRQLTPIDSCPDHDPHDALNHHPLKLDEDVDRSAVGPVGWL